MFSPSSSRPVSPRPTSPSPPTRDWPTSPSSPTRAWPTSPSSPTQAWRTTPFYSTLAPKNKANLRTKRRRQQRRQQRRRPQRSNDVGFTPTAGSLGETVPTALNLSEITLESVEGGIFRPVSQGCVPPPPVGLGSVEGLQQSKERRPPSPYLPTGHVGGKFSALVDLPGDENPSSDLADTCDGPSQTKEVSKPYWDTDHVLAWRDPDLPTPIYVRVDLSQDSPRFHMYPNLCGSLQSLEEVESAVDAHARGKHIGRSKELPHKERAHQFLYWPDGTKKVCTKLEIAKRAQEDVHRLVEALLDKRNDDEYRADELKDIVHWQSICEGVDEWYYHLNITVKTKGVADDKDSGKLFFAEVTRDQNDMPGYFLSRFCRVNSDSKGLCHGCTINGSTDMKHPRAHLYKGGHRRNVFPLGFGPCNGNLLTDLMNRVKKMDDDAKMRKAQEDAEMIKAKEDRIRKCYDYLDDDKFMEEFFGKNSTAGSRAY